MFLNRQAKMSRIQNCSSREVEISVDLEFGPRHADSCVYPIYSDGYDCSYCDISHSLAYYEDNIQKGNDMMEYLIQQGATLTGNM
jgi:hypothetical protein